MVIVIREGPGFPLIRPGSHKSNQDALSALRPPFTRPLGEGLVMIFDANIAREDPTVEGVGGAAILLLY